MKSIERGDILLVNLAPTIGSEQQGKSRPCLVVSPAALNDVFRGIIVCPITDAKHIKQSDLGLTFIPSGDGGLSKDSVVIAFQIRMIDKRRIIRALGTVSHSVLSEVDEFLRAVLDLP